MAENINNGESGSSVRGKMNNAFDELNDHVADTANPHGVTKSQVGLGNVADALQQPLDSDLSALAALNVAGFLARTGTGTAAARSITGTANRIVVTNGDGVSGNPTLDVGNEVALVADSQQIANQIKLKFRFRDINSAESVGDTDFWNVIVCTVTAAGYNLTCPALSSIPQWTAGYPVIVYNLATSANPVGIVGAGGVTVDGASSVGAGRAAILIARSNLLWYALPL